MRIWRLKYIRSTPFCLLLLIAQTACGTNTDTPAYPLYSIVSPVSAPAITGVTPVSSPTAANPLRFEFDVNYYISNKEETFLGYNLYITSSAVAAESTFTGVVGDPYLEDGIEPSFRHTGTTASTHSTALQTQRVENYTPAPSPQSFQYCEVYYFRLTAVVYNGTQSNASPQVEACAAGSAIACPVGTPCNPDS